MFILKLLTDRETRLNCSVLKPQSVRETRLNRDLNVLRVNYRFEKKITLFHCINFR